MKASKPTGNNTISNKPAAIFFCKAIIPVVDDAMVGYSRRQIKLRCYKWYGLRSCTSAGAEAGTKLEKAQALGLTILDETQFRELVSP